MRSSESGRAALREKARANGHRPGRFISRKSRRDGSHMYYVCWCERCGSALFDEGSGAGGVNPCVDNKCSGSRAG